MEANKQFNPLTLLKFLAALLSMVALVAALKADNLGGALVLAAIFLLAISSLFPKLETVVSHEHLERLELGRAKRGDYRALGPVIALVRCGTRSTQVKARRLIVQMLPRIQRSHAELFTQDIQRELLDLIHGDEDRLDVELLTASLKPFRRFGGIQALAELQSICVKISERGVTDEHLVQDLRVCIQTLRVRAEREAARESLLHPISIDDEETLLRPNIGRPNDDLSLLRAAPGDHSE